MTSTSPDSGMQTSPEDAAQDGDQAQNNTKQTNDNDAGGLRMSGVVKVDTEQLLEDGRQTTTMAELGAPLLSLSAGEEGQLGRCCFGCSCVSVRKAFVVSICCCTSTISAAILTQRYPAREPTAPRRGRHSR